MRFTKMHGLGNDYVYLDAFEDPALLTLDLAAVARALSDRHRGVGGDGVILIAPPEAPTHHARMRTFNADGSESPACGNGTRCVAMYLRQRRGVRDEVLRIESGQRVLLCQADDQSVGVEMGAPGLALADCHIDPAGLEGTDPPTIDLAGRPLRFHAVSMGNPHAVVFAHENAWLGQDLARLARELGPAIERHRAFTQRTNAHMVRIDDPTHATVHTWERGAGPTLACGTGACATLVAAVRAGLMQTHATLALPGGSLQVAWSPTEEGGDGIVRQRGPACLVFDGTLDRALAERLGYFSGVGERRGARPHP